MEAFHRWLLCSRRPVMRAVTPLSAFSMPTFSLRSLFVLVSLSGIAAYLLSRPTLATAVATMFAAICSISILGATARRKRCCVSFFVALLCCCYLCLADGGIIPRSARYLPTEWLLSECSTSGMYFDNGRRRSNSLTIWTSRLCTEENHKDFGIVATAQSKTHFSYANDVNQETIDLPSFTTTTASTTVVALRRDDPHNKPFFIIGHCTFVIVISMLTPFIRNREKPIVSPDGAG